MISAQKKSQRQEQRLARAIGGTVTPGSGNGWLRKNDVRADDLSIEAKYTDAKQFTLKQADLHKGERNALIDGREFAFSVSFSGDEWAVVRIDDLLLLRHRSAELDSLKERYEEHISRCSMPQQVVTSGW